ncbi:MAG: hypothetical protein KAR83_02035 [Thermodesulfovibrionales bacterium]|nr:hypothetical protein [Thermodesulfovibrionales bacterium]
MNFFKLLALAVVMSSFVLAAPALADENLYDISVEGSPYLGAKDAPVTIIEFLDYQ